MENITIKRADFESILKLISRVEDALDTLKEELEIISNKEFAGKIEEGLVDIDEGRVYGVAEFERALKNK